MRANVAQGKRTFMHLSIRSKLTLAFVLVLLPFLVLQFVNIQERTAAGKQAVIDNLRGSAQTAAATMDAYIAEIIRKQQSAAQAVGGERSLTKAEMNAALAQVRAPGTSSTVHVLAVPVVIPKLEALSRSLQPFAQYLAYVDNRGVVIAADPSSLAGSDMSAETEVAAVLQRGLVWADSGFKADVAAGERQSPGFAVCLGLRSTGPTSALCAGIESVSLRDVLPSLTPGDQVVVLDSRGQVIYSSQTISLTSTQRDWSALPFVAEAGAGRPTSYEIVSPIDGQAYLGAQTRVASLDWIMGVYRQRDAALAPVAAATRREAILFALIAGMTLALTQVMGMLLAQPIVDLTNHARQLSRGDLKHAIDIKTGDETQTLAESFNAMAQSLDRTIGDLVDAQTQIARQSEQLQQLLVRTNAVQEDERRRIAFDIHDGVIQLVIAAGYEVQAATRQLGANGVDAARAKLDRARQLLDQTVTEMRRIVFDLHPTSLDSRGLMPSLEKYAASWQESTGIACAFSVQGEQVELAPATKVGVYRIVQEALTNIRKHAGATQVEIAAQFTAGRLHLTVQDNGSGFSVAQSQDNGGHLGLMSMTERARTLGGHLDIASQPGHGTRIALEVPV